MPPDRVNFLVGGTQKGGTTALAEFLSAHPEICFSRRKEVHFFDNDPLFAGHQLQYNRYHQYFNPGESTRAIGEATPSYMYWKSALQRIRHYNPEMKWILILRNPVERAYSHYNMEIRENRENLSFSDAIRIERTRLLHTQTNQHRVFSYLDRGYYSKQIKRITSEFPKNQLITVKTEDLQHRQTETLELLFDFLGLDKSPATEIQPRTIFASEYEDMPDTDRQYLQETFKQEIEELENLLDWDCTAWKK